MNDILVIYVQNYVSDFYFIFYNHLVLRHLSSIVFNISQDCLEDNEEKMNNIIFMMTVVLVVLLSVVVVVVVIYFIN